MSSSGTPSFAPAENPDAPGRGPLIMGLTWTMTSLTIIVLTVRFYVRSKARLVGAEDWTIIIAGVLQVVWQVFFTISHGWGHGKHDRDLVYDPQLINIAKWIYLGMIPTQLVSITARISASIMLIRLFGVMRWFKWYLYIFTSAQTVIGITYLCLLFTRSKPVEGLWTPLMPAERHPISRASNVGYAAQAMFTFSDLTYVLFPVGIIWRLNMRLRTKIYLCLLMSLSLVTMAASLLKSVYGSLGTGHVTNNNQELQYDSSLSVVWAGLEQSLVIILTCVPALRVISKMDFPYLRSIRSSLVKFVRGTPRESRETDLNQQGSKRPFYVNLEAQPGVQKTRIFQIHKWEGPEVSSPVYMMERRDEAFGSRAELRGIDQYKANYERGIDPKTNG